MLTVHRPGPAPHRDDLRALCGDRLVEVTGRADAHAALGRLLTTAPFGSHVHTCGPAGLITAVARIARAAHWIDARIHAEAFVPEPGPGAGFRAVLHRSGRSVEVGARETLLDAVHRVGVAAPAMCRRGVCGECVTPVLDGEVEHRDTVLTDDERADRMALCVSRAAGTALGLDL
ncbi:flavin reductase family protein [Pseudonocardia sp. ICBG1293]|uniref:flavin reductase family protein n=1 Tax=Pseudonocardia sp. ICBG1293 TaxID=2844382 RepID=UPI001CC98FCF|nr:iron-sulfur cluster-binding domain-containing protein [Pseudonocardia sp. ICBG1293]